MNSIEPIRTATDYQQALASIESIFEATPGTLEFDELGVLTTLVQAYDAAHHPILDSDSVEYIKYKMQERGLRQRDVAQWLGGESRVSDVLSRKRKLTAKTVEALH